MTPIPAIYALSALVLTLFGTVAYIALINFILLTSAWLAAFILKRVITFITVKIYG
jgi:hypothetical protein